MKLPTLKTLSYLSHYYVWMLKHPLNRGRPLRTIGRYLAWQIGSRLLKYPVLYPFVNDLRLALGTSYWGATGVVYFGLEEYEDMAFCAHLLRPGDLFVDVGACFGTYTLLAAGPGGANTVTFEPNPNTAKILRENIRLNRLDERAEVRVTAVGAQKGSVRLTDSLIGANHIVMPGADDYGGTVEAPLTTLDSELAGRSPLLIKIDVEGFEQDVLDGAVEILKRDSVVAVIMEDVGLHARYHVASDAHLRMLDLGFQSYRYDPIGRQLTDLQGGQNRSQMNTLYLRNVPLIQDRLSTAPKFRIRDRLI